MQTRVQVAPINTVTVQAHARLHMGFFDMHGGLGRKFGSLGLSLDSPVMEIQASIADELTITGNIDAKSHENITKSIQNLQKVLNLKSLIRLDVISLIPCHAGLGSGTQMMLTLCEIVNSLHNLGLNPIEIAQLSGRGKRSGIGLGTFQQGGVVVDAGRNESTKAPPVVARVNFPEAWWVLLIFDNSRQGVHGNQELVAFKNLPEFPSSLADKLCRYVLMQALPALHECDLTAFGEAVRALQLATGEHFQKAQGGLYASQKVATVLNWLETEKVACYGQSSWGPTGFSIFENKQTAVLYLDRLQQALGQDVHLSFMLTTGCNTGASLSKT